ncbi:hypothetical protein BMS3Abin09_00304 [bacterium BMS3Abin09]|nr:hypothetical protein BMS3Abin09_00304 [bacterium BMS3Abin09]
MEGPGRVGAHEFDLDLMPLPEVRSQGGMFLFKELSETFTKKFLLYAEINEPWAGYLYVVKQLQLFRIYFFNDLFGYGTRIFFQELCQTHRYRERKIPHSLIFRDLYLNIRQIFDFPLLFEAIERALNYSCYFLFHEQ